MIWQQVILSRDIIISPVSPSRRNLMEGHRAMNISDFAEDYLIDVPIEIGTLSPWGKDHKDGMRKLTAWLLNEVMQQEALNQIQAQPYERTVKRRARRNGTRKRSLKTIHGDVILDKPQFREFPFKTQVFQSYSRVEMSLKVAIAESYLQGISTRKVEEVVSKFGLENVSASEVSRIAEELDKKVKEFLDKPIEEPIPYLFVDASYFKVRTEGRYVNKALLIVTGINPEIVESSLPISPDRNNR